MRGGNGVVFFFSFIPEFINVTLVIWNAYGFGKSELVSYYYYSAFDEFETFIQKQNKDVKWNGLLKTNNIYELYRICIFFWLHEG